MCNADFVVGYPPGVESKHSDEHAKVGEGMGWLDYPECCVLVFSRQVAFASHINSYETEAAVKPLALLEFHGCVVMLERHREDTP